MAAALIFTSTSLVSGKEDAGKGALAELPAEVAIWQSYIDEHSGRNFADWLSQDPERERPLAQGQVPSLRRVEREMSGLLNGTAGKNSFPNLGLGIFRRGVPVYEKAVGFDLDTRRPIASVTKTFTAVAVLQLAERGQISLDDNIALYFPDLQISSNPRDGVPVTVRRLLQQTSGMPYTHARADVIPAPARDGSYSALHQIAPAGSRFMYSNYNYYVLAALIEKVSGLSYANYIEENIFVPAGMTNSHVAPYAEGSSGIASSVNDLSRFFIALMGHETRGSQVQRLLDEESVRQLWEVPDAADMNDPHVAYYGMGIRVQYRDGKPHELFHTGIWYGVFAEIRYFLSEESCLIHIGNPPYFRTRAVNEYRWRAAHLASEYVKILDSAFSRPGE